MPPGYLQFVNQVSGSDCARVIEVVVDPLFGAAHEVWSYQPEPCLSTFALGGVKRLPNGNTNITFSTAGVFEQVDPDGRSVLRATSEFGFAFGYGDYADSLYVPRSPELP